jgi:TP901 family phage tail tape measure protein
MAMNMDAVLKIRADVQGASNIRALSGGFQGLAQAAQLSTADLGKLNIQINRQARETGNTIVGMKAYATALGQLRDRVEIGSKAWSRLGVQIEGVKAKMAAANAVQEATPRIVGNNLNAIQQQITRLRQLRQEVEIGSRKFELYTAGIDRLNARMGAAGQGGAAPAAGWRQMAGAGAGALVMGGGVEGAIGGATGPLMAGGPAGMALAGGVMVTAGLAVASTRNALDEEASIRRIRTLSDDSENLMMKIRQLTTEQGHLSNSADAGAAAYEILSSGFSKTDDVLAILKASTYGATGGFSDIKTVADGATSIMNSFGLSADKVTQVVDQMVQTQNDGKIVVDQYAQSIGQLAPTFAVAGLSVEEMNAAISALTAKGAPVGTTISGLTQAVKSIIKPTDESKRAAAALGIEFNAAALQAKGLGGFLEDVMLKTKGNTTALGEIFPDIDGFRAVVSLTNDQLKIYNKSLENMDSKTAQAADAAKKAVDPVKQFDNAWKDFSATLGRLVLPALTGTLEFLTIILDTVQKIDWSKVAIGAQAQDGGPAAGRYQGGALPATRLQPYTVAGITYDPITGRPTPESVAVSERLTSNKKTDDPTIDALLKGSGADALKDQLALALAQETAAKNTLKTNIELSRTDQLRVALSQKIVEYNRIEREFAASKLNSQEKSLSILKLESDYRTQVNAINRQAQEKARADAMQLQKNRDQEGIKLVDAQIQALQSSQALAVFGLTEAKALEAKLKGLEEVSRLEGLSLQAKGAAEISDAELKGVGEQALAIYYKQVDVLLEAQNIRKRNIELELIALRYTDQRATLETAREKNAEVSQAGSAINGLRAGIAKSLGQSTFGFERTRLAEQRISRARQLSDGEESIILYQKQQAELRNKGVDKYAAEIEALQKIIDKERQSLEIKKEYLPIMDELELKQQKLNEFAERYGGIFDSIGQGLTKTFDLLVTGTDNWGKSLQTIASTVLQDVAKQLLKVLVIDQAISAFKNIFSPVKDSGAIGNLFNPAMAANGMVFAANGIQPFAQGGIVSRPTLFPFAKGIGLMGEAGPEAIMPLRRGADGKLGVAGGGGSTTINVSVDAKGSSVQGDSGQGGALARVIAGAVQNELVKQRRPGGLLAS